MKKQLLLGCILSLLFLLAPATARADCCLVESDPCDARDHVDARCDGGTRSQGHLDNVFDCYSSGFIIISPLDPISYLIAIALGEGYCSAENGDAVCEPTLPDSDCDDTDGDGLFNLWETTGIDGDGDGNVDVTLPGADPNRLDLFVEVDCLVSDGNGDGDYDDVEDHSHCPQAAAVETVARSFANAPRANVDGTTGVQLHIDTGPLYGSGVVSSVAGGAGVTGTFGDLGGGGTRIAEAGNEIVDWDGAAGDPAADFYALKAGAFDARRALAYRWALYAHQTNARQPKNDCTSGWAETPGNDLILSLGGFSDDAGTPCSWAKDAGGFAVGDANQQAGAFMHELGHTLGLQHGGNDGVNYKPNYLSAMNYSFWLGYTASPTHPQLAPGGLDYSRIGLPELVESNLDECLGQDGGQLGYGAIDWDHDSVREGETSCMPPNASNVWADTNGDGGCIALGDDGLLQSVPGGDDQAQPGSPNLLGGPNLACETAAAGDDAQVAAVGFVQPAVPGYDDWPNLVFAFRTLPSFNDGPSNVSSDEPDPASIAAARQRMSDLLQPQALVHVGAPATALPGDVLALTLQITNGGFGPGLEASLTNTDPAGAEASIDVGALRVGETHDFAVGFTVPADACPIDLVDTAVVELVDIVGEPYTVTAGSSTVVLDIVPPVITLNGPAAPILECGVQAYAELGATALDHCDPDVPVIIGGDAVDPSQTGTYVVDYTATDDWNNQSIANRVVTVADTLPPELSVSVSPTVLSPPNHKMVQITPTFVVDDACDPAPAVTLVSIVSNEPANGTGDGNTDGDILVDAQGHIFLRAERKGNGSGRIYTLTFAATDAAGNATTKTATVHVPKGNQ